MENGHEIIGFIDADELRYRFVAYTDYQGL